MSEEAAFLQTFSPNPAGDTARLVYADWLEEHERPVDAARQRVLACPDDDGMRLAFAAAVEGTDAAWAEFVRAQVELAKTPEPMLLTVGGIQLPGEDTARYEGGVCVECRKTRAQRVRCRYHAIRNREQELLSHDGSVEWVKSLAVAMGFSPIRGEHAYEFGTRGGTRRSDTWFRQWEFHRGFIESVTCTAADWLKHAPAIRDAQPVRKVTLTTWADHFELRWKNGHTLDSCATLCTSEPPEELRLYDGSSPLAWDGTYREQSIKALQLVYPGIEFELPSSAPLVTADDFTYQGAYTAP